MPKGRRRQAPESAFDRLLADELENRVLDFDSAAAAAAASLAAERRKAGRPVDMRDTQIAGIALARRATLATRNVRRFADLKVDRHGSLGSRDGVADAGFAPAAHPPGLANAAGLA